LQSDVIFADPPYDFELEQFLKIVDLVFTNNILHKDGVLIIEILSTPTYQNIKTIVTINVMVEMCLVFLKTSTL